MSVNVRQIHSGQSASALHCAHHTHRCVHGCSAVERKGRLPSVVSGTPYRTLNAIATQHTSHPPLLTAVVCLMLLPYALIASYGGLSICSFTVLRNAGLSSSALSTRDARLVRLDRPLPSHTPQLLPRPTRPTVHVQPNHTINRQQTQQRSSLTQAPLTAQADSTVARQWVVGRSDDDRASAGGVQLQPRTACQARREAARVYAYRGCTVTSPSATCATSLPTVSIPVQLTPGNSSQAANKR